jgi:hypothetical protein
MRDRFQISTSREQTHVFFYRRNPKFQQSPNLFTTDSKAFITLPGAPFHTPAVNGLGRAFTETPKDLKVFHPEAVRRDL